MQIDIKKGGYRKLINCESCNKMYEQMSSLRMAQQLDQHSNSPAETGLFPSCIHPFLPRLSGRNWFDFATEQTYLNFIDEQPKQVLV